MAILSREGRWLRVNSAFGEAFGWREEELQGQPVLRLVHADDHGRLGSSLLGDEADDVELHLLTSRGSFRGGRWRFTRARADDAVLCVGKLLSEHDEARVQARILHLTNEIEHRVRNNLAVIRSIIRRTGESYNESQAFAHLQGRVDAYARVQSTLRVAGDDYRGVDLAALIEDELLAQSIREGDDLAIGGPEIALTARAAEVIGLAAHELAMNSIKFGAFCVDGARIDISWDIVPGEDGGKLVLIWSETGLELDDAPVHGDGFGMEMLLQSLPYDLGAETRFDFRREGIRFTMSAPLDRIAAPSPGR